MTKKDCFFPVRHLSPSAAWHLIKYLNKMNPDIVLVEGPSDANSQINNIVDKRVKLPIAILAYTEKLPVKTILYPLAEYSPEYQAIKWAKENKRQVRFIDLPTSVFLALEGIKQEPYKEDSDINIYDKVSKAYNDIDYDTFWERNFEHNLNEDTFRLGMMEFSKNLRLFTETKDNDGARNIVREAFMKNQINKAVSEGYSKMVIVTGAYHTSSLLNENTIALTDEEINNLPRQDSNLTLMPYSYYRLSSRSGYGAGNKAPNYYQIMWEYMNNGKLYELSHYYMTFLASSMREEGHIKSSAEVIEAVRLSNGLTKLHDGYMPTLQDLRDGAKTCLGDGVFSKISNAVAKVEIGTSIGSLPDGMSNTSLQNNFNFMLKDLKLDRYKSVVANNLTLDLRENRRVKTEKSAFLDLNRSFFLHQLEVLGVSFGKSIYSNQEAANWKEEWIICWRPETEIEIVESALYGDTVEMATAYTLKEKLDNCTQIKEAAAIISKCYECGMPKMVTYAVNTLQTLSVEANAFDEISGAAFNISCIIRFGNVRKINLTLLEPILSQLFLRASLIMVDSADCNNDGVKHMAEAIEQIDKIATYHEKIVDYNTYIDELIKLSNRDDRNPKLSGIACSILLERTLIDKDMLIKEISRRLLPGIPADIGAGWFEGLASRNRYIILANLTIWEKLDDYITSLALEDLKSAIVFLHRTFSEFNPNEKHMIAENLANIWGVDSDKLSEYLNNELSEEDEKMLKDLEEFDFGDL